MEGKENRDKDLIHHLTKTEEKYNSAVENSEIERQSQEEVENKLRNESEHAYIEIAKNIVQFSKDSMKEVSKQKAILRKTFNMALIIFLAIEYVVLGILLFVPNDLITERVVIVYMTAIIVETLTAFGIMVKFAFDAKSEVELLKTLHKVIESYQKFDHGSDVIKHEIKAEICDRCKWNRDK